MVKALNLYFKEEKKRLIREDNLNFQFDLASFFHFYKIINAKALSERIGMHQSLSAQYITGKKRPSETQVKKIMTGVHDAAKELLELKIA